MKPLEIVESIKAENPDAFGKLKDKLAAKVIKVAMAELAKQLNEMEEGTLRVAGLGSFKVSQVTRQQDGQEVKVKRVTLHLKAKTAEETEATEA